MKLNFIVASLFFFANLTSLFFLFSGSKQTNQKDFIFFIAGSYEGKHLIFPNSNTIGLITYCISTFTKVLMIPLIHFAKEIFYKTIPFGRATVTLKPSFGIELLADNDPHMRRSYTSNFDWRDELNNVLSRIQCDFLNRVKGNIYV